jgi:hypothetical protein
MSEGGLSHEAIIVIVVFGAAAMVAGGYGVHRALAARSKNDEFERKFNERNVEQDQYMVDLRMAYRQGIMAEARGYKPRPVPGHGPMRSQETSPYEESVMSSR